MELVKPFPIDQLSAKLQRFILTLCTRQTLDQIVLRQYLKLKRILNMMKLTPKRHKRNANAIKIINSQVKYQRFLICQLIILRLIFKSSDYALVHLFLNLDYILVTGNIWQSWMLYDALNRKRGCSITILLILFFKLSHIHLLCLLQMHIIRYCNKNVFNWKRQFITLI